MTTQHNAPQPHNPTSAHEILLEARSTLTSIKGLVRGENAALENTRNKQNLPLLEAALPEKKKLSLRLERLINALKQQRATIQSDAELKASADAFNEDMKAFQDDALKNLNKLRAAHKLRADFIGMVKDTVMRQGASQTYGANGNMSENTGPTRSVMGKSV